jgi:excisionase family DNA binding protein
MNEKLLNVKEVSDYLNVSKASLYTYAKEHEIPSIKIKGRLLFCEKDLETWLGTKKQEAKS